MFSSSSAATHSGTSLGSLSPCPRRPSSPSPQAKSCPAEWLSETPSLDDSTVTSTTAAVCQTPQATLVVLNPLKASTSRGTMVLLRSPWPRAPKVPSPNVNSWPADVTAAVCQGPHEIYDTCMPSMSPLTFFGIQ
uniref:Uncharacterized protein MANES_01G187200 n=1 Tax=Rhizophora mucronata TaxID=61149 RepID=A0A2P2NFY2_RHIMU